MPARRHKDVKSKLRFSSRRASSLHFKRTAALMATAGGFVRGEFEAAEVAQDIADREAQLRGSMAKSMARAVDLLPSPIS